MPKAKAKPTKKVVKKKSVMHQQVPAKVGYAILAIVVVIMVLALTSH